MSTRFASNIGYMKIFFGAALFLAGVAMSTTAMSTQLYGGGSTLPAGGYIGWNWVASGTRLAPDSSQSPAVTIDPSSMFGAWATSTGNSVQYCQTASGRGKRVLDGDSITSLPQTPGGLCGVYGNPMAPRGFQIPSTAIGQPDFAVSDAPITASEYATFVSNYGASKGEPIQFPALVDSIAIVYRNLDMAVSSKINLTTAQVCGIFAGTLTNWHDINSSFASKQIHVVYRLDSSGATFNLMNHLNAVCGTSIPSGTHFIVDQVFSTGAGGLPIASSASSIGADGDPVVIATVNATDGAIGYAGAADDLNQLFSNTRYATVDNRDPVTDLPATFTLPAGSVMFDKVVNGAGTLVTITPNSTANCLAIVNPGVTANPSSGYSIIGVSYLLANQKGNSTNLTTVRSLLGFMYTHAGVTKVGTGVAFIGNAGISPIKITACTAA